MNHVHLAHVAGHMFKHSKSMPSVGSGKSAMLAFLMGFLFGPLGVGLYLRSLPDFFLSLALVLIGAFVTVGIGAPVFWCLCGAWAAVRVHNANKA
jgi:hypothetical protein